MNRRKYALLLLALVALSGCSKDERKAVRIDDTGGGDINNTLPTPTPTPFSNVSDSISDSAFTLRIKKFLAIAADETTDDIDIGIVKATATTATEGLQVRLNLGQSASAFTSLLNVPASGISLTVKIYDSYTYSDSTVCGGRPCGAITIPFAASAVTITDVGGGQTEISFNDEAGELWFIGSINGDFFSGRMYFQNSKNPYNGALGNFSIPKCQLLTDGCN